MMRNISQLQIYNGGTAMITFEEFADAYAAAEIYNKLIMYEL